MDGTQHVFYSNRSAAYLSNGDVEKALEDAEGCIKLKGDWAKGYSRKGAALHAMKQYPESVAAYEAGLEVDPSNAACSNGVAEVTLAMKTPSNPLGNMFGPDVLDKIKSNPRIAHLANDASFLVILRQLQANPSSLGTHLADPRVMSCLSELMGVNIQSGGAGDAPPSKSANDTPYEPEPMEVELSSEEQESKDKLDGALEAKKRGNALYKNKEFSAAIDAYNEAIELDATQMSFYTNRAAVRMEMKEYDACIADCKQAITVGRENRADYALIAKAYVRIGNAYLKKGDDFLKDGIDAFEGAQMENRTREVETKIKQTKAAFKKASARAYIDPTKAAEAKEEGNVFFKGGDFPSAVARYSEAIKRDPTNAVYYANRAAAYTKLTSFNEAKSDCDKSLELDPKYVKAWSRLAAIQCFMKEFHKAMDSYQKGLDLEPENQDCKDGLQRVAMLIRESQGGEVDKERAAHAMADPEIQSILRDPVMQSVLQDFQTDPRAAQRHLQNADVMKKVEKLIAAGVLQTK